MRYCHRLAVRNRLRITAPGSPCLSQLIMQQRPIMIPNHCSSYTACHGHGFRQSTFGNGHKRAWLCTDTAPPASGHLVPVPAPYMHKETSAGGPKKKKKNLPSLSLPLGKPLSRKRLRLRERHLPRPNLTSEGCLTDVPLHPGFGHALCLLVPALWPVCIITGGHLEAWRDERCDLLGEY